MGLMFKISAYPFGQMKTKMYLPENPFFKKSLAGASGLVLMLVPAHRNGMSICVFPGECLGLVNLPQLEL